MMSRRRKSAEIARDRRQIARYYLRGDTQDEIAEKTGLSQATVSRDLRALHHIWLENADVDYDEAVARELANIDHLEVVYWRAWEKSTRKKISRKSEQEAAGSTLGKSKDVVKTEWRDGDPRFLRGVEWCINKRCEILGIDAPRSVDITTGGDKLNERDDERFDRAISTLASTLGDIIHQSSEKEIGNMDSGE